MNRGDSDKPLGNGGFSRVSDFLVVATAIISAAISIWSIKKSTKFEQEWNQKQLDADLKSKARIEWIQKVRENTAELISLYYKMLKETNKDGAFVRALCESVNSGRTSYTEAYRLTNTTSKTFSEAASGLGGVLW